MIEETYKQSWKKWVKLNFMGILDSYWDIIEEFSREKGLQLTEEQKLKFLSILVQIRHPYYLIRDLVRYQGRQDEDLPEEIKKLIEEVTSEIS